MVVGMAIMKMEPRLTIFFNT